MKRIYYVIICLLMVSFCGHAMSKYVGGDISLLTKYEEKGAIYYNENGEHVYYDDNGDILFVSDY